MLALCGWLILRPVPLMPFRTRNLALADRSDPSFLIHLMWKMALPRRCSIVCSFVLCSMLVCGFVCLGYVSHDTWLVAFCQINVSRSDGLVFS